MIRRNAVGFLVGLALLLLAAVAWGVVGLRSGHGRRAVGPPPTGAYLTGGAPAFDPALDKLLADDLTDLVIATDNARHGSSDDPLRSRELAALRDAPAMVGRSRGLTAAWRELLGALDRWTGTPRFTKDFKAARADLVHAARLVTAELAALGLGYYLEAEAVLADRAAHAAIFVYRVDHVAPVRIGGAASRVLELRRLDKLNMTHTLLGMQRTDELSDPVVLLDRIDEFVADRVWPTFARWQPYPLGDDDFRSTPTGRTLAEAAGEAIRADLLATLPHGSDDSAEELVRQVRTIVTTTVRHHEARHAYDLDRERPLRYPAQLSALAGNADDAFTTSARAELAGYLSQITSDQRTPQLALWNLASQAFQRRRWGSAESYAAVVVLEGLARVRSGGRVAPAVQRGSLDRGRLAELALPLAGLTDDALRAAARSLWLELYGEPVLPIVDVEPGIARLGS